MDGPGLAGTSISLPVPPPASGLPDLPVAPVTRLTALTAPHPVPSAAASSLESAPAMPRLTTPAFASPMMLLNNAARAGRRRRKRKPSIRSRLWVAISQHLFKTTCLFFDAVQSGRVEDVRSMVAENPRLLLRTKPGTLWNAAHLAAEQGDFQMTTVVFELAESFDQTAVLSRGPIASCLPTKTSKATRQLLCAATEKNLTPLMLACKRGHPSTASFLLGKGADALTADREGSKMAIHYASLYGHWSCVHVLLDPAWTVTGRDGSPVRLATAIVNDAHGEQKYLDTRTCAGLTPLHMAAWAGHTEVAKILLQAGALMSPRTVHSSPTTTSVLPGSTPLHLAARKNRIHVVKVILLAFLERRRQQHEAGVPELQRETDPRTICDEHGNYAVMHAIARGNNNMAALLDADASLEVLLVNDGGQLGQLPKLATLAMAVLRVRLLSELDALIATLPRPSTKDDLSESDLATSPTSKQADLLADGTAHGLATRSEASCTAGGLDMQLPNACDSVRERCADSLHSQHKADCLRGRSFTSSLADSVCASEDDNYCSICMENPALIELTKCQHSMCAPCAHKLLVVGTSSACQCPFCRMYIASFRTSTRSHAKDQ